MPNPRAVHATAAELIALLGRGPFLRRDALAAGVGPGRIRAAVDAGTVLTPHRGVLLPTQTWAAATDMRARHLVRIRAALLVAPYEAAAVHGSAGILHVLQRPDSREPELVHLGVPGEPDRTRDGIRIHESALPPEARTTVDGIPTTGVARTGVDLARGRRLPSALVPLDSALRALVAERYGPEQIRALVHDAAAVEAAREELRQGLRQVYAWPGTVIVREAIELADPAAESAHESRSRGWFIEAELPPAQLGARVRGADGRWYWVDFLWEEHGLIGEADGWGKYGSTQEEVTSRFRAEKRRQDALEGTGRRFVRWTTDEGRDAVVTRVGSALRSPRVPARNVVKPAV